MLGVATLSAITLTNLLEGEVLWIDVVGEDGIEELPNSLSEDGEDLDEKNIQTLLGVMMYRRAKVKAMK